MRVLLDECVSEGLRNYLAEHECQTARYAGFAGLENGQLLTAAEAAKFEVHLTVDRGFEYQQNQWWALSDLNGRPFGCKPNALTAELSALTQFIVQEAGQSVNAAGAGFFCCHHPEQICRG